MKVADAVMLAPELVGDEPETADPEALVDVDPNAPEPEPLPEVAEAPDPTPDELEPGPEPLPDPEDPDEADVVSLAETGQTVVEVYTVSVTLPTEQCLTVGAQDVMV